MVCGENLLVLLDCLQQNLPVYIGPIIQYNYLSKLKNSQILKS